MTGLANCYGRPDLAEVRPMTLAQLYEAAARCGGCPFRRECPPTPGYMCAGKVCVGTEKWGLTTPRLITVPEYARMRGIAPRRGRARPPIAGQLHLFALPARRKQVAA